MSIAIVTGSSGLVGSEAARHFSLKGLDIIGIDNNLRRHFFGADASSEWQRPDLERQLGAAYRHFDIDIRDAQALESVFREHGSAISLIVHTAAQPSHDWAAREPKTDFEVNALATLHLLEATRRHAPDAVFIFTSTSKVYGDTPNGLPLVELETRWDIEPAHHYAAGIREDMSIDQCLHSLFGASKVAADILVQEYARYFGLRAVSFRPGCLTGPNHSAVAMHGFLSHLLKCVATGLPYTVYGYGGKQVRDNLHSADLAKAFDCVFTDPRPGEVYNIGGGRGCNCSILEAVHVAEELIGRKANLTYTDANRIGDHKWWISDATKFQSHYPQWGGSYNTRTLCEDILDHALQRWTASAEPRR